MNKNIFFIAIVWAIIYNSFFGWNFIANTFEELMCDGVFAILISLSILNNKE